MLLNVNVDSFVGRQQEAEPKVRIHNAQTIQSRSWKLQSTTAQVSFVNRSGRTTSSALALHEVGICLKCILLQEFSSCTVLSRFPSPGRPSIEPGADVCKKPSQQRRRCVLKIRRDDSTWLGQVERPCSASSQTRTLAAGTADSSTIPGRIDQLHLELGHDERRTGERVLIPTNWW